MTPAQERELEILDYLRQAVASPIGIEIEILSETDIDDIRAYIYTVKREYPEFEQLSLLRSPTDINRLLWICKRAPDAQSRDDQTHPEPTSG